MRRVAQVLVATASLCLAGLALAAAPGQTFAVPGHGSVTLAIPGQWTSELRQPDDGSPPTVALKSHAGALFEAYITLLWPVGTADKTFTDDALEEMVRGAAQASESQSTEVTLAIKPLAGTGGKGYYFAATDKDPKPGEFKYMKQGMLQGSRVTLAFTILSNDGQEALAQAALDLVAGAQQHAQ